MFILFLLTLLPLMEITGFIIIGGKIGIGLSLLWVIADMIAGLTLLTTMGGQTLRKAKKSVADDIYPFEEMFDGFCIIIGALLLIFPGFISDALALPLLIAPIRSGIFKFLKYQHSSIFNNLSKSSQGFTYWYYEERNGPAKTIDGDFRRTDEEDKRLH
jgi:UPF0716 protein FxsA